MAFCAGQKTDQAVLPQQHALEFESADTPRNRDETGLEDRDAVPGTEHRRGETVRRSPTPGGVTPAPFRAGEQGREARTTTGDQYVFVLDKHHRPLQPCAPARARKLLAKGKAVVHHHTPFTIRLKNRVAEESEVSGVEIGVDPGSRHTGIAVFTARNGERQGRFSIQVNHRGSLISKKLRQRTGYRRGRRSRNLRYRSPRFNNRARPAGWLAPSLRHRVETTVSWVDRLSRWVPVRAVHVERVSFDTHVLSAGRFLEGAEYSHGTLHGCEVREYLLEKFDRTCVYCGITGVPLNIDHVHPRSRGGSDRVSNLVLACVACNQAKADQLVEEFAPAVAARVLVRAKAPLRDAAAAQSTRWALWRALKERLPTYVGSGGRTKWNRTRNGLPKSHTLDALAVGRVDSITRITSTVLVAGSCGRGTYSRTRPDKHGFPRLRLPRKKRIFGYSTGDLVRAVIPSGKNAGSHTSRVAVRSGGSHTVQTRNGPAKTSSKNLRLLQRADGYTYITQKEAGVSSPA